ncbi:MAG: stress-induced protein [Pantoea eucrina]|uniref:general stress protein n=1 Tax=Pantoea sp. SIMBA_079 TaxID=3085817 RepID=UPI0026EF054F|nr:stress-induced protein [Pantoea eucrina]
MLTQHQGGAGNFAEETRRISEAGKKGGQNSGIGLNNDREKYLTLAKKGLRMAIMAPDNRFYG